MTPPIRPVILPSVHYGIISLIPCLIKVFPLFLQDMNDALSFLLEKGHTYTFAYENSRGEKTTVEVLVGNDPMTVEGYMQ